MKREINTNCMNAVTPIELHALLFQLTLINTLAISCLSFPLAAATLDLLIVTESMLVRFFLTREPFSTVNFVRPFGM